MDEALSFEDLGVWDDLLDDGVSSAGSDEEFPDPRSIDPRITPPDVVEIDRCLAELEAELARLRMKKAHILASRALIYRLPAEIMSRIFEFGVHDVPELLTVLSLVCRHWRELALATPSLWTYIILKSPWNIPSFVCKLRVFLARAQMCKLLIDIDQNYLDFEELQEVMVELRPHFARCFSFRLSSPSWDFVSSMREYLADLGPSLEMLHLRIHGSNLLESMPYRTLLAPECSRLKSIVLEHIPLACIYQCHFSALRRLYLMRDLQYRDRRGHNGRFGIFFKDLVTTLRATPTIEEVRFQSVAFLVEGNEEVFQSDPAVTIIPSLRVLSFYLVDSPNIALFLESTSLPALTRLSVNMEPSSDENMHWLSCMSSALRSRSPSLRQLDLRACNIDGTALVSFVRALHQLPQLTALSLSSPRLGPLSMQFFELLAAGPATTGAWILPQLRALCVQQCGEITGHELLRVVRARRDTAISDANGICFLKIAHCEGLDEEVLEQLRSVVHTVRVI
ncbi:hypothetical protein BKA93DRAFT_493351 [Sparassis latifolia]|uniref:F-box domain-containing protein n=1 Tax=Sparassis crispa TaxID=139825 RepID=A0A401GNI5_9APHY|nr:hypothetical protein SCP_0508180 [Sparassis crispa]GBE83762.1 hypothetical protein SCP_0508180 [Sparassis crispa]